MYNTSLSRGFLETGVYPCEEIKKMLPVQDATLDMLISVDSEGNVSEALSQFSYLAVTESSIYDQ